MIEDAVRFLGPPFLSIVSMIPNQYVIPTFYMPP